jgi:hypothetical protein
MVKVTEVGKVEYAGVCWMEDYVGGHGALGFILEEVEG